MTVFHYCVFRTPKGWRVLDDSGEQLDFVTRPAALAALLVIIAAHRAARCGVTVEIQGDDAEAERLAIEPRGSAPLSRSAR